MKITDRQVKDMRLFLCKGISCSNCPFLENNGERCRLNYLLCEKGIDHELFTIVKKNKEYFNRCKELNSGYWNTVKILFGATLK